MNMGIGWELVSTNTTPGLAARGIRLYAFSAASQGFSMFPVDVFDWQVKVVS